MGTTDEWPGCNDIYKDMEINIWNKIPYYELFCSRVHTATLKLFTLLTSLKCVSSKFYHLGL